MPAVSPIQLENARPRQGAVSGAHDPLRSANLANYYLRTALDQSTEGVLILRPASEDWSGPKVIYSNSRMALLTGADPLAGMRGMQLRDLIPSSVEYEALMEALQRAHRQGGGGEWQGNLKTAYDQRQEYCNWRIRAVQNEFGQLQNYTLTISPTKNTSAAIAVDARVASATDVLQENKRNRNDQLAAMSQGVLHDLNNLLGIIMTNLSAISNPSSPDGLASREQTSHHIQEALAAAMQAREFTSQTLCLAKDVPSTRESIDIGQLVKSTTRIAQSGSGVKLHMHLASDLWWTVADRPRLAQVIQNLVINAIQAMNDNGSMEVTGRNVMVPENHSLLPAGPHVEILVRDRGCGMTPDVLTRVLQEPYTTKVGGSGIGLSTCRRVIEEHGGKMHISSMVGIGTEVYFWMPASLPPAEPQHEANPSCPSQEDASKPLVSGVGAILVVDDEDRLRQVIVTVLSQCGYQVYEAREGAEAIDIYRRLMRQGEEIDLVVMDLTLKGGLNGEEALHHIKQMNPSAKIVASSGALVPQSKDQYLQMGFCDILPKPYLAPDIADLVHRHVMKRHPR